eukprot:2876185-Prymnesium_polylepis.1
MALKFMSMCVNGLRGRGTRHEHGTRAERANGASGVPHRNTQTRCRHGPGPSCGVRGGGGSGVAHPRRAARRVYSGAR